MSLGVILVGLAIAMVTIAYIARPFRAAAARTAAPDVDQLIEAWVHSVAAASPSTAPAEGDFCPQCGRQVASDHHFCPACGERLSREGKPHPLE